MTQKKEKKFNLVNKREEFWLFLEKHFEPPHFVLKLVSSQNVNSLFFIGQS